MQRNIQINTEKRPHRDTENQRVNILRHRETGKEMHTHRHKHTDMLHIQRDTET